MSGARRLSLKEAKVAFCILQCAPDVARDSAIQAALYPGETLTHKKDLLVREAVAYARHKLLVHRITIERVRSQGYRIPTADAETMRRLVMAGVI